MFFDNYFFYLRVLKINIFFFIPCLIKFIHEWVKTMIEKYSIVIDSDTFAALTIEDIVSLHLERLIL